MLTRGVLYIVWGNKSDKVLLRSIESLKKFHPDLPIHVERISANSGGHFGLIKKASMADITPFEETLFLDADTVVLGNLDFGFKKGIDFGLACCICECPWARRYYKSGISGDTIEYNTGVLFFTKKSKHIFDTWKKYATIIDSSIPFINKMNNISTMPFNDQGSFAKSIEDNKFSPFVLPLNWNLRANWQATFFGPIKIWHDYSKVPEALIEIISYYEEPDSIIQFVNLLELLKE